jgi:hypothetical protein
MSALAQLHKTQGPGKPTVDAIESLLAALKQHNIPLNPAPGFATKPGGRISFPCGKSFPAAGHPPDQTPPDNGYAFQAAQGSGVYEIPVGPIHAGIIEPGHFRFLAVDEQVLNLEERLGYVRKGIEKIAEGPAPAPRHHGGPRLGRLPSHGTGGGCRGAGAGLDPAGHPGGARAHRQPPERYRAICNSAASSTWRGPAAWISISGATPPTRLPPD